MHNLSFIPSFESNHSGIGLCQPQTTEDGRRIGPRHWGITKSQVRDFHNLCKKSSSWDSGCSVRTLVDKFIKPMTVAKRMGVSLLWNQRVPKEVNLMVSHAWEENAEDFFLDVIEHMRDDEVAFICFLSLFQGTTEEIHAQLGDDIEKGPFADVIDSLNRLHGRLLVVPNEALKVNGQGLFSRLWCDWEIFCASQRRIPIYFTHRNTRQHLLGKGSHSSRDACCGSPDEAMNADETAIRKAIQDLPMSMENIFPKIIFGVEACISLVVLAVTYSSGWAWPIIAFSCAICVGLSNLMLSSAVIDGYDLLDNVIETTAVGGIPGSHTSFGTSAALTLLCVLNGITSVLSNLDQSCNLLFLYFGLLLGVACMYPHRRIGTRFTREITTFVIRVVSAILMLTCASIFVWCFNNKLAAVSGEHIGLTIALGVTWHNRLWWHRMVIGILATCLPIISFFMLRGLLADWEVMWACSFVSTIGLAVGTTATGTGHTVFNRGIRIASIIIGVIAGSFNINTFHFGFRRSPPLPKYWFLCPWMGALLGSEVGLSATQTVSRDGWGQAAVVLVFAGFGIAGNILGDAAGGLVGCIVGHQLGSAITIHAARKRRKIRVRRQSFRVSMLQGGPRAGAPPDDRTF